MSNERKTEAIVRQHFQADSTYLDGNVIWEEQCSDSPKIDKLLSNASKAGTGKGYPEFIVSFKDNPNFIIVIECKADILKHESKHRKQYKDYAVDGVLLYSDYLSKQFDVLSLAVSGTEKNDIKVSYFMQTMGQKANRIFGNSLLSFADILGGVYEDEVLKHTKYEQLLTYSQALNAQLHQSKIKEDKRSLLVSGILIALDSNDFYISYSGIRDMSLLGGALVTTIKKQLKTSGIQTDKIDMMMQNYQFLQTDNGLIKPEPGNKSLKDYIDTIDENINNYVRTYKYYDILGQFYIEFLRYSNADKGLGIVLTPPHITDFFSDIVHIQPSDIVYDNCTGTSGFLVSAMKKMVEKCNGDKTLERRIKTHHLFGTERQDEIYPLAVSNMFLHGDGKSNILHGSCFDADIIQKIKSKKPTVAFLNPPYKSNKKKDIEEFKFVLNALECLQHRGRCVAIIPSSCVLATGGERGRLKQQLLDKHTLKAVFSMPDELFYNSKVGMVTSVVVIEAHTPHPPTKDTFFGYFKHDGFYKKKTKKRFDYDNRWGKISAKWLDLFENNKVESGYSVTKKVSAVDEWCVEEYMEIDYSVLSSALLEKKVRDLVAFKIANNIPLPKIIGDIQCTPKITLDVRNWQPFYLRSIFDLSLGSPIHKVDIDDNNRGDSPYITRTADNNGTELFLKSDCFIAKKSKGECITIGAEGMRAFYQHCDFYTGNKVNIIRCNRLNKYSALFIATVLDLEMAKRFNYGRAAVKNRLQRLKIKLPADKNGNPDWRFMEQYMKSLPYSNML